MTLSEAAEEFLLYIEKVRAFSGATVLAYRNDLCQLVRFLDGRRAALEDVTPADLRGCIARLSALGRSSASVNRFIAAVRSLFAYCRKYGHIERNPALELRTVKLGKTLPRFMTEAEVDELCEMPDRAGILWPARDKAIFEMLYSSGCRVAELAGLNFGDFADGWGKALVTGKGGKQRYVYFEDDARSALQAYLSERRMRETAQGGSSSWRRSDAVLVNQRGARLTTQGIGYILSRYSGVEGTGRHVNPHAFRHTFATSMLGNGADVRVVQEMLGHASLSTTQRYTHITTARLIDVYNKAHPHGGTK